MYRDPTGVRQWEGKFKTRHDAQKRLNEVLGEIDKGTYSRRSSVTFEKFAEDWLASRRRIRGSTEAGYGSIINRQLVPRLGSISVADLRFEHVDAAVSGMIEDELSTKTIHNAVTFRTGKIHLLPARSRFSRKGDLRQQGAAAALAPW
jgi:hypothetical protein